MRKSLWETLGGMDESLPCGEDYDFFLRASRLTRIDQLDQVAAFYRIHNASTTHTVRDENHECTVLLRALQNWGPRGPDGREVSPVLLRERLYALFFGHGYRHFHRGKPEIALQSFRQAIVRGKPTWRAAAYLVLSAIRRFVRPARKG